MKLKNLFCLMTASLASCSTFLERRPTLDHGLEIDPELLATRFPINLHTFDYAQQPRHLSQETTTDKDPKDNRFYLYQRVKMPLDKDGRITLHFGLNNDTFTSQPIQFVPDLAENNVIMNINQNGCLEENSCFSVNQDNRESADYQQVTYDYFIGESFLGVNRVRPGELVIESVKEVSEFHQLPIRFTDKSEAVKSNVLGLAPNSPVWNYWNHVYHFPSKFINLSFSFNKENEYVMFDSAIHHDKEVLFKVRKDEKFFRFRGIMNLKMGEDADKIIQDFAEGKVKEGKFGVETNICVANQRDMLMRMTRPEFDKIKRLLCKTPENCGKASDLYPDPKFTLSLTVENYKDKSVPFMTVFFPSALYKIEAGDIVWKIDALTPEESMSSCEVILEQHFLREKYFLVSNPIDDNEFMYIGFKLMEVSDFYKFDFYTITMIILILTSVSLLIIYIILNHSLKKLLKKESLEAE